ncbi:hypothetical protein SLEP1_g50456 [Rubroshorea leprosula]|uniref:Uncharacterized protein n=1 Tax=Rubroshorea leprosula TaxID=152421 RepID=A0AAV5M0Z0_9ROSI|nr:hypothetical protein SLEP1_g50456 [Rubroshorea leprosula]
MQLPYVTEEECVGEDDDEEEEFDGMETSEEEEQPTVTQPPLVDDQFTGDDATMEEDTEEHNLEAKLDAKFAMLDPKLDAQLEEELSRAVPEIGRGMDKRDTLRQTRVKGRCLALIAEAHSSMRDYIVGTVSETSFIELKRRGFGICFLLLLVWV